MSEAEVLLVDDDPDVRAALAASLRLAGHRVAEAADGARALPMLDQDWPGVLLTDLRMPGIDGWALFRHARGVDPDLPVILMTAHGDIPEAVAALKVGAWDFLAKPFDPERLLESVSRALAMRRLVLENRALRARIEAESRIPLIGQSPAMVAVRRRIAELAPTDLGILILGETGTGKSLAAQLLHEASLRARQPFVTIDCGALPPDQLDAELFGHVPGAFPGAARRTGRIEAAHRGTLFLDGVGHLSADAQARLLGVLDRREVRPLGSSQPRTVDIRVLASATDAAAMATLRADLRYRLEGVQLQLPPLRHRRGDIPLLFAHFAAVEARAARRPDATPPAAMLERLAAEDWPGNLHALRRRAEQFALGVAAGPAPAAEALPLSRQVAQFEASLIESALRDSGGDIADCCARLGLPRKTLYDKLARHGLVPARYRRDGARAAR